MPGPLLFDGPKDAERVLILAHGAGAPMDSPFMVAFAEGLGGRGVRVVRFEFPYMQARRETGRKQPPDREAVLLQAWRDVYSACTAGNAFVGGKSMGGRMASMVADELGAAGLVCLGYPFHAPGRPDKPRIEHLRELRTPALILQGTRDTFGRREEVEGYELAPTIRIQWIEDGNHDLESGKVSGWARDANWSEGIAAVAEFVRRPL